MNASVSCAPLDKRVVSSWLSDFDCTTCLISSLTIYYDLTDSSSKEVPKTHDGN